MDILLYRSDEIEVEDVQALAPARIIVSSGEDTPADAGISLPLIREFAVDTPILGIGLGHAAVAVAFGGRIVDAASPAQDQDVETPIFHTGRGICASLPSPIEMRVVPAPGVERGSLPIELEIAAWTGDGRIMAIRHRGLPTAGIQFRPATWSSKDGLQLLRNFLVQHPTDST
jgi:anthranilate synthase component 2